jgi:carbon storage regulator
MLVLTRKINEAIVIGGGIRVRVVAIRGKQVRLSIEAPPSVSIRRQELPEGGGRPPSAPPR